MKIIKVTECWGCPFRVRISMGATQAAFCAQSSRQVTLLETEDSIASDCPLEDYPAGQSIEEKRKSLEECFVESINSPGEDAPAKLKGLKRD